MQHFIFLQKKMMKSLYILVIICLSSSLSAQNHPFIERQINGFIDGSTSIAVEDFNQDGLKDILAFPIKKRGVGLFTNNDELDFDLKTSWFNVDINAVTYADIYQSNHTDLILFSDSSVQLVKATVDTFITNHNFNIQNSIYKIEKTHNDDQFIALDSTGIISLVSVDTTNITLSPILEQYFISSFEVTGVDGDTTHLFAYSDSLKQLTHLKYFDNSTQINLTIDSIHINHKFSIFNDSKPHVVCSLAEKDTILHIQINPNTSLEIDTISNENQVVSIINAYQDSDSLFFYYLHEDFSYQQFYQKYYDGGSLINKVTWHNDSIYADDLLLEYMNYCEILLPVNLDADIENELVLFSERIEQITIYKNQDNFFNITRSGSTTAYYHIMEVAVADMDLDGDLDAVCLMKGSSSKINGLHVVYYENIGDFKFRNKVVDTYPYSSSSNSRPSKAIKIIRDGRPEIFIKIGRWSIKRFWIDDEGEFLSAIVDPDATFNSSYSHGELYKCDIDGDGDDDIVTLGSHERVIVYQNRDSTFHRYLGNCWVTGCLNYYADDFVIFDHNGDGSENLIASINQHKLKRHGQLIALANSQPTNTYLELLSSGGVGKFSPSLSQDVKDDIPRFGYYHDWNFDGYFDLSTRTYSRGTGVFLNNGNNTLDTTFYQLEGSPILNDVADFENDFVPRSIRVTTSSVGRILVYVTAPIDDISPFSVVDMHTGLFHTSSSFFSDYNSHRSNSNRSFKLADDLDEDGDLDLIRENLFGGVSYFENTTCKSKSILNIDFCDQYESPSGNYTWQTPGTYYDVLQNSKGCDSTIRVNLNSTVSYKTLSVSECANYQSPSGLYNWNETGTYNDTLINQAGCDSILTIDLTIGNTQKELNITQCDSMISPSQQYTWYASGVYLDTSIESSGCKTFYEINLEIETAEAEIYQADSLLYLVEVGSEINQISWYDCFKDSILSFDTDEFAPDSSGFFAAIIQSSNCVDTLACFDYKQPLASQANIYIDNQNINIEFNGAVSNLNVDLFNMNGQLIKSFKDQYITNQKINMSTYPSGIYFLAINFNKENIKEKIPWFRNE